MDQIKIGTFIKNSRKEVKLTQSDLAERLGVTDRAVSKWENGKCMPDAATIPELCEILNISINELFIGEKIMKDETAEVKIQDALISLKKDSEKKNKMLIVTETVLIIISILLVIGASILTEYYVTDKLLQVILMAGSITILLIVIGISFAIELNAGIYVCKECGKTYQMTFKQLMTALHMGRTRRLRCPYCGVKSWSKLYSSEEKAKGVANK